MSATEPPFPNADDLVRRNADYAATLDGSHFNVNPSRSLAVVACMDSRIDAFAVLGLNNGDAHIIRNAGGVITDDVIRSLCLSQRFLGTREIVLVHHTDCGLASLNEEQFMADLEVETGSTPSWRVQAFDDPYDDVRESIDRLQASPFLPHTDAIRGFVYDVSDGRLREVRVDVHE